MPWSKLRPAKVSNHPGSNAQEVEDEPDWSQSHLHRIGFFNRQHRMAGLTHDGDHEPLQNEEDLKFEEEALRKIRALQQKKQKGQLVNFKQVMKYQSDHARQEPNLYPPGFRFVVRAREDWVRKEEDWPANIKQREKEEEAKIEEKKSTEDETANGAEENQNDDESDWRREQGRGGDKHHEAYGRVSQEGEDSKKSKENGKEDKPKSKYQKLRETYSPNEIILLEHLNHEANQTRNLTQNDGKQESPVKNIVEHRDTAIDAQDAMTPDNWIPRNNNLVRWTGQHPFNAEPRLDLLYAAGLITPNGLHYVRNHAAVPRLYWDEFKLDINHGQLILSMDDIVQKFEPVNIPIAMACDGNRRGELNKIKKSKGFDWSSGAISCAYWKGALLVDVLDAADISIAKYPLNGKRYWLNFAGADSPSEGTYETSIPLSYALDPANDVLLAYEMNNSPLPADHGYPLRLMIPGWVGGRCIKWLKAIWISDHENESYYHIWDNRVLPAFITEKDGEFAKTMFSHPSTACNEQNLNSVIVHPGQSEILSIQDILKRDTYRIEGYAYEGGGHEIQRVEISLDQGKSWLYCLRHFSPAPIRNGNRFWAWIHWHIDVDSAHFARAEAIQVRAFNVFKNTQPEHPVWNLMGMMNNGWYTVRASTISDSKTGKASIIFRHPFHQQDNDGWMISSTENRLAAAQQDSGTPQKQFTREEIEKHRSKEDAWMVVNNNVYDVTSVLSWHPGGSATILTNAGHLSLEVTDSFNSIHDDYAHKKLQECAIGRVTDKAARFMTEQAKALAEEAANDKSSNTLLQSKKWVPVTLIARKEISKDTFTYTFSYTDKNSYKSSLSGKSPTRLGLGTCQHIQFGIHMLDKMLIRSYTPTRPIETSDDDGTFELTVKTYFADENQPGGAFSNFLLELPIGESVDVCGPTGDIEYLGHCSFDLQGSQKKFAKVNLVVGGSGLTPAYALIERVLGEVKKAENTDSNNDELLQIRVIDANKTEDDILLHEKLNQAEKESRGRILITHVLSHPKDKDAWTKKKGYTGHVNADIIREKLFKPSEKSITFLCGPPGLIQKAVLPALKDWGFEEGENVFGF